MKKFYLLLLTQLLVSILFAQVTGPVNPQVEKLEYEGYTIRLFSLSAGSIGYDIFTNNKLILHQSFNPFTGGSIGLNSKEEAYRVAKWQIAQLKMDKASLQVTNKAHVPLKLENNTNNITNTALFKVANSPIINPLISRKIATELKIKVN
jgi:hypothetical protein